MSLVSTRQKDNLGCQIFLTVNWQGDQIIWAVFKSLRKLTNRKIN